MSFPSHPRGWFSIFLYRYLIYTEFQHMKPVGINVRASPALQRVIRGRLLYRI